MFVQPPNLDGAQLEKYQAGSIGVKLVLFLFVCLVVCMSDLFGLFDLFISLVVTKM